MAIGAGSNVLAGSMPASGATEVVADPDQGNATVLDVRVPAVPEVTPG